MSNRRQPTAKPATTKPEAASATTTVVNGDVVIEQYAHELAQERHARIVAQCAQRQLETEVARLTALLPDDDKEG